jgi:hypothetical protein
LKRVRLAEKDHAEGKRIVFLLHGSFTQGYLLHAPQHSPAGEQQAPSGQQVVVFLLTSRAQQHACGGLQQAPSGQQAGAFTLTTSDAQHGDPGKQHSEPG